MKGWIAFYGLATSALLTAFTAGGWVQQHWIDQPKIDRAERERANAFDLANQSMGIQGAVTDDLRKCLAVLHAPRTERMNGQR